MSIADKLSIIAENEQKVYNAGYSKGETAGVSKGFNDGYTDGYGCGKIDGYSEGYTEGETKGIEQGKQAEVKRWWTLYQRSSYNPFPYKYAGGTWNANTFTPQFSDFVKGSGAYMFKNNGVPNIKAAYAKTGSVLDISACTWGEQMFSGALTQELGVMDMSKLTASGSTIEMYAYNASLWKIEKIICVAQTYFANSTFGGLSALKYIEFEGEIGKSINFQWSTKLTAESIRSIINHLSSTTSGLSVTLSLTAVKKAFETSSGANDGNTSEEWLNLIATKPNWTINLV